MAELTAENVDILAGAYLEHLGELSPDTMYVSNKTPLNFLRIGLIKLLFPDAAILHCRRDPRDTLLSIYFQNFAVQQTFSTDLESLGQYYLSYAHMMGYWDALFPGSILDVDYQRMTDDVAASVRRVLDFLGLPWDDACLRFHETKRRVDTPSLRQVRQPIYRSAQGRWRHYRKELEPLLDVLAPVLEAER